MTLRTTWTASTIAPSTKSVDGIKPAGDELNPTATSPVEEFLSDSAELSLERSEAESAESRRRREWEDEQ